MAKVQLRGQDAVLKHLKKIANPDKLFDKALDQTASNSLSKLQRDSLPKNPKITGMSMSETSKAWTEPRKVSPGKYQVENKRKSGKWNIARLINDGHGEIKPKKKFLYIPLNKKAASKRPGANIPDNLIRSKKKGDGGDYVFATKIKAKAGTGFIEKNITDSSRELTRRVIKAIRNVYR